MRGFDGETSLPGECGWLVRNDLGIALRRSGVDLYAGFDCDEVAGPSAQRLPGRRLAGGAIGMRAAFRGLNHDLFVGAPISRPEGHRTARVTSGVNLNYSFQAR